MKKIFKKHKIKIIYALILAIILSTQFQPTKAFYQALLTVPELIQNSSFHPLAIVTRKPKIKEVVIENSGRPIYADIYIPNDRRKHVAAVLDLGLDIDRKDPRVVKVAETFARNGYIILAPNIPYLSSRRFTKSAIDDFIASYQYLSSLPNTKGDRLGFIGFCTSGGLTLIAAENERIANEVSFVLTINPYFDLKSLYKVLTIREIDGQKWTPHFKSVEVYNRETIALLENAEDRAILIKNLVDIGEENLSNGNFPALSEAEKKKLSKEGTFVYNGLTNKDPKISSFYLNNVNEVQKKFKEEMSPSTKIDKLNSKTYIFVDKNFNYIPFTEGKLLAKALKEKGKDYTFGETAVIPTSKFIRRPTLKTHLTEGPKLVRFLFTFFREIN